MTSSKFSARRRIQPTPPICKEAPSPFPYWQYPYYDCPLIAYARMYWPGSPYGAEIQQSFTLSPGPSYAHWYGISQRATDQLAIDFSHNYYAAQWDLTLEFWRLGYKVDQWTQYNVPMRKLEPLWTQLVQLTPPTPTQLIEAWVAL